MSADIEQILETVTDGVVLFNSEGEHSFLNDRAREIFQLSAEKDPRLGKIKQELSQVQVGYLSLPHSFEIDGVDDKCNMMCTLLSLKNGYAAIVKDCSVRARQAVFVDNILMLLNHELRTPMNGFIGSVQLAAELLSGNDSIDPEEMEKLADIASRTGRTITDKLERLLELSKLQSVEPIISDERNSVTELALEAYDKILPYAANKLVTINLDGFDALGAVYGPHNWLVMAIGECLMNAVEHSDNESGISFTARQHGNYVQLSIRDYGKGINPGIADAIYNAFRVGEKPTVQSQNGLGIGLSLSKRIVELSGGNIRVISGRSPGTEIVIELPTGAPVKAIEGQYARQAFRYAEDIAVLMSARNAHSETHELGI